MQRFGTGGIISFSSVLCLSAAFAACTSSITGADAGNTAGSTGAVIPGNTAGTTSTVPPGGGDAVPPAGTTPPVDSCERALPASFTTLCSACHTQAGQANTRYPDLYDFMGTIDDFRQHVRMGSPKGMAPYGPDLIADADVQAIFQYFTGGTMRAADAIALGDLKPLYSPGDAKNPPIVTKLADGTIVTRGAGRVRGRHEKEGSYGTYGPHYFENRSYGFIVEDFTPTGVQHIRTTYLPIAMPDHTGNRITNWRAWKQTGNNATFMINEYMDDIPASPVMPMGPVAQVQQKDQTTVPGSRKMEVGQNFEFEFGIFIAKDALASAGSRDSYYTDTFRYRIGEGGMTANNLDYDQTPGPLPDARLGGDTTIAWLIAEPEMYFGQMALNTQQENVQNFLEGRRLFHTDFETGEHSEEGNPGFTAQAGKAGPMLNTTSCENCHIRNGPGELLTGALDEKSSMVFKLYGAGSLGNQLQLQEGSASVSGTEMKSVTLGDGTTVNLSRPKFTVTATSGDASHYSARLARKLIGMGLLEAIDEQTILARADRLDCDQDGISGRPSYVTDPVTQLLRLGRFGWKAEKIDVSHQVADAAMADLGVGTSILPDGGKIELDDTDLMKLTTYMRLIGVPPQRDHARADVLKGEQLFKTVGCANCHVTDVVTSANHPFSELRSQAIKPFTDLLLHDLGEELADDSGVPLGQDANAVPGASEWRTPPLWGIGLYETVNGHTGLLHDGRAKTVLEAALWHGGEAQKVKERFMALPAADRDALVAFVMSL
jgi:CxxC motif-containing protein (DUF1111 family)/mono/diheme cytochrome c family protein